MFILATILLISSIIEFSYAGGQSQPAPQVDILKYSNYENCQGKEASNYTLLIQVPVDQFCTKNVDSINDSDNLIANNPSNKQLSVNSLRALAKASWPAGAYTQAEKLWLSTSGSLEGKYVYEKTIYLNSAYLKKCSSVLGYSYVSSKSTTLLIADKLDLNALLSPNGAYDVFKKSASTVCQGVAYCF